MEEPSQTPDFKELALYINFLTAEFRMKLDHDSGETQVFNYGDNQLPMEPVFVNKKGAKTEDDGYLIGIVYDANHNRSYLAVMDTLNFSSEPMAKLHFDQALPVAFHGNFSPAL